MSELGSERSWAEMRSDLEARIADLAAEVAALRADKAIVDRAWANLARLRDGDAASGQDGETT